MWITFKSSMFLLFSFTCQAAKWRHLPYWNLPRPANKATGPSSPAFYSLQEVKTGLRQMQRELRRNGPHSRRGTCP